MIRLKMKTKILFASLLLLSVMSCQKKLDKTRDQLLTDHNWVYADYLNDYSLPTSLLVYKIEKTDNTLDLSLNIVRFKTDRTYEESIRDEVVKTGTWSYNANSEVEVKDASGTLLYTIITLDANFFTWTNKDKDTFGTMTNPYP